MKRIFSVLAMLCPFLGMGQPIAIKGKIINEGMEPVVGATISLKGTGKITTTNSKGEFTLLETKLFDTLIVSSVGYETQEVPNKERGLVTVILQRRVGLLREVEVNTGYQQMARERATGSFAVIDNGLLNRRMGTSLLDRIENAAPGLFLNRADKGTRNALTIRGRSTLYANTEPLIILDNFPYDGDLASINPADIETVTLLKDAAAASIWGARAGNGVLVLTTKKGRTSKPQLTFASTHTFTERPDLFSLSSISSADYVELEKFLYGKGFYTASITHPGRPPLTPVVELLVAKEAGTISATEADAQIEALKTHDARGDISRHLYRTGAVQQYNLGLSGNTPVVNYYFSAGFDQGRSNLVGMENDRLTLRSQNTFKLHPKIDILAGLTFTQRGSTTGNNPGHLLHNGAGKSLYPYARLVDDSDHPVPLLRDYRGSFVEEAESAGLLPWTYNPIEDIGLSRTKGRLRDYLLNTGLVVRLTSALTAEARYQYQSSVNGDQTVNEAESYFARNLVNQFTQVDPSGKLSYPVPLGGMISRSDRELQSHQTRAQLTYRKFWGAHHISAIGGGEIKDLRALSRTFTLYGYNSEGSVVVDNMDFVTRYTRYDNPFFTEAIPNNQTLQGTTDRFLSAFANAGYSYKNRYSLSLSARKDASNLFGVRTNQKGVPLWSAGLKWDAHREDFYKLSFLPRFSLRATYGYQGNIARNTSAFTTASYSTSPVTGALVATINNPPNESLRWEKSRLINLGLDFALPNDRLSGSVEYYRKRATDLMGRAPVDGTLGLGANNGASSFFGNTASMKARGWDVQLEARPLEGRLKWYSAFLFSAVRNEVTDYSMPVTTLGNSYLSEAFINPVVGRPLFSIYAFRWAGLNASGDPVGYIDGGESTNYAALYGTTPLDSLVFAGSLYPETFGSWRNTLEWGALSLTWVISYKGNYAFRRPSINYGNLFNTWAGPGDYALRWQKPGDEARTSVPALVYPANTNRDRFYTNSEVLVERGDHIRLEDVGLAWELEKSRQRWLPFRQLRLSLMATGLGTLWVANKHGLDPYYLSSPRPGRSLSLGINVQL